MKEHWEYFTNWWLNNVLRMEAHTRAYVLPAMLAAAFLFWAWAFKLTKKDLKAFPYALYILGGLVFGVAVWIMTSS